MAGELQDEREKVGFHQRGNLNDMHNLEDGTQEKSRFNNKICEMEAHGSQGARREHVRLREVWNKMHKQHDRQLQVCRLAANRISNHSERTRASWRC